MSSGLTHPNKVLLRKTGIILYEKKDGYNLLVLLKLQQLFTSILVYSISATFVPTYVGNNLRCSYNDQSKEFNQKTKNKGQEG